MNLTVSVTQQLPTRVKEYYYYLLLGNPYICRRSSSWQRQTCKNSQLFLTSESTLSAKPLEILSFLPPLEYLCKQVTPEQKYLISSGSKAKVSHIMLYPCHFLCPCSSLQDKKKKDQSADTWNQPSDLAPTVWNPFPDCLPSLAL